MLQKIIARLPGNKFKPYYPNRVDQSAIIAQAADFFGFPSAETRAHYQTYRQFHLSQQYEQRLGERKTLAFEEAFLLYLSAMRLRPAQVVEIGVQYGKSTRRIVDLLQLLNLPSQVTCFDISDDLQFVDREEVNFRLHDLTSDFNQVVLSELQPGLIYLDARPYHLLKQVISGFLHWSETHPAILAVHDCSAALYNPHMAVCKDDSTAITSKSGIWERHVLAEVLGVEPALLDDVTTPTHRLRVFGTPHGLALLAPHSVLKTEG